MNVHDYIILYISLYYVQCIIKLHAHYIIYMYTVYTCIFMYIYVLYVHANYICTIHAINVYYNYNYVNEYT